MKISVTAQVKEAKKYLKDYQRKRLGPAISRALNKTLTGTVVDTKNLMVKKINMTKKEIGQRISKKPASAKPGYNRYEAVMVVRERKKPNLSSFKGTKALKGRKGSRGGGVTGKVWNKRIKYKNAFIWSRGKVGGGTAETVFHRVKGAKRLPIKPIFGDSVSGLLTQRPKQGRSIKSALRPKIRARFGIELDRQIARIKQ